MYVVKMTIGDNDEYSIEPPKPTFRTENYSIEYEDKTEYYDIFQYYAEAYRFYESNREEIDKDNHS